MDISNTRALLRASQAHNRSTVHNLASCSALVRKGHTVCSSLASSPGSLARRSKSSNCLRKARHWSGIKNSHDPARDPCLSDYVEVQVDSVRHIKGSPSVVYLRLQEEPRHCLSVWIGDAESQAMLRELHKDPKSGRPLTYDLTKDLIAMVGSRVTKVRIHEIVSDIYYARVHLSRPAGEPDVDVDARPSDAINLALRFKAPIFVRKHIALLATAYPIAANESEADIAASVRSILAEFVDPTVMDTLQKDLAVHEERFKDALACQLRIAHEVTHNRLLRLVVAMEAALNDKRYDEAARFRDEYVQLSAEPREKAATTTAATSANGAAGEAAR